MAPEVIEMSGVCAASDIWSVGCTVIELLTCSPPYYELQPMPALFRIVQDVQPPIPEGFSPEITDFLRQCFQKDSIQRPDAKTLLMHPWLQNSRRASPSPRQTHPRHIDMDDEVPSSDNHAGFSDPPGDTQAPVASDIEQEDGTKELVSLSAGQVFHEKLPLESSPGVTDLNGKIKHEPSQDVLPTKVARSSQESKNGDSKDLEPESKDHSSFEDDDAFSFQAGKQNVTFLEEAKPLVPEGANGLSRFSDTPGDASLEDLFPIDKRGDHGAVASTSTTAQELRDRMVSQKQKGNDNVPMNGGKLLELFENFMTTFQERIFSLYSLWNTAK
ncbi:unnamed protein product [Triticum turgidum subsp. durum]|uniref:non-specific serine/threonine protein kinase n=1 Tax=Triticum turgidum subsp. durum TaxID=4567 RepID=A0A9R1P601_TRITD|nr:unnamed protein product [Triticum turgidum subsp. durum]